MVINSENEASEFYDFLLNNNNKSALMRSPWSPVTMAMEASSCHLAVSTSSGAASSRSPMSSSTRSSAEWMLSPITDSVLSAIVSKPREKLLSGKL